MTTPFFQTVTRRSWGYPIRSDVDGFRDVVGRVGELVEILHEAAHDVSDPHLFSEYGAETPDDWL